MWLVQTHSAVERQSQDSNPGSDLKKNRKKEKRESALLAALMLDSLRFSLNVSTEFEEKMRRAESVRLTCEACQKQHRHLGGDSRPAAGGAGHLTMDFPLGAFARTRFPWDRSPQHRAASPFPCAARAARAWCAAWRLSWQVLGDGDG